MRNVKFIGLGALNTAIAERLVIVNRQPMRHVGKSRLELLESLDRPAPFEMENWKLAKVAIDYHVEFDHHFYSVPRNHRAHAQWTPERFVRWAADIGPHTVDVIAQILDSRVHPQQAFRSCLGIPRLAKHTSPERLEAACQRAKARGVVRYRSIKFILKAGLDAEPIAPLDAVVTPPHANIRGADYFI